MMNRNTQLCFAFPNTASHLTSQVFQRLGSGRNVRARARGVPRSRRAHDASAASTSRVCAARVTRTTELAAQVCASFTSVETIELFPLSLFAIVAFAIAIGFYAVQNQESCDASAILSCVVLTACRVNEFKPEAGPASCAPCPGSAVAVNTGSANCSCTDPHLAWNWKTKACTGALCLVAVIVSQRQRNEHEVNVFETSASVRCSVRILQVPSRGRVPRGRRRSTWTGVSAPAASTPTAAGAAARRSAARSPSSAPTPRCSAWIQWTWRSASTWG